MLKIYKREIFLFFSMGIILFSSCTAIRKVKAPVKGESTVCVSLGGPITEVSKKYIPLPLLGIGYNYGLSEKIALEGGLNITNALFGVVNADAGVNWYPLKPQNIKPGFLLMSKLFVLSKLKMKDNRIYPAITPVFYWEIDKHIIYTGVENWFEFHSIRNDGNPQKHHWLKIPMIGYELVWKSWQFQVEGRVYLPDVKNTYGPTHNLGFGEYGILGIFIGTAYSFGGKK